MRTNKQDISTNTTMKRNRFISSSQFRNITALGAGGGFGVADNNLTANTSPRCVAGPKSCHTTPPAQDVAYGSGGLNDAVVGGASQIVWPAT
jgi:hypothetical protein